MSETRLIVAHHSGGDVVARAREHVEMEVAVERRHHRIQKVLRRRIGQLERGHRGVGLRMVLLVPPKLAGRL